jgi:lycopene cyclase domain-containing protein
MMTYWLLNIPFLLVALGVTVISVIRGTPPRLGALALAGVVMMTLTAVFDNAIIGFGLVDYDPARISGLRLGFAPLEDFAYTVAALLIVPALWHMMEPRARKATP